jgi:hypothetical protein
MNVCVPTYLQQDAAAAAFEDFNLPKKQIIINSAVGQT